VVQAALKLLEEHGQDMLRQALIDGENSGDAGSLTMQDIMRAARDEAIQKATMG
jgi:antitoxin ParD1/3/4